MMLIRSRCATWLFGLPLLAIGCGGNVASDEPRGGDAGDETPAVCTTSMCGSSCVDTRSDASNCGACGVACAAGEICDGGTCVICDGRLEGGRCLVTLVAGESPEHIAINSTWVFWTNQIVVDGGYADTVMRVPKGGGTPTMIASGYGDITALAADETNIYWLAPDKRTLMTARIEGGAPATLATENLVSGGIALDSTYVYFPTAISDTRTGVMKVPIKGGTPTLVVSLSEGGPLGNIVVDATSVYWAGIETIEKAPIAGGPVTLLASYPYAVDTAGIAVDSTNVYWTRADAELLLMKIPLGGGTPTPIAGSPCGPGPITVDGTAVYWGNAGRSDCAGTIMKLAIGARDPTALAPVDSFFATGIAVDARSVYWVNLEAGDVMKLTPK